MDVVHTEDGDFAGVATAVDVVDAVDAVGVVGAVDALVEVQLEGEFVRELRQHLGQALGVLAYLRLTQLEDSKLGLMHRYVLERS